MEAFDTRAVDYLLKPFARERFEEAVQHVIAQQGAGGDPLQALEADLVTSPDPVFRFHSGVPV